MTWYPLAPWELRGQLHVTVWRVPSAHLPWLGAGLEPVRAGGIALVGTAWVTYEPGGVLSYRELLVAVRVHQGRRPVMTITDIWVDSVASLRGGRELWSIPKQWASFHVDGATCAAVDADGELIAGAAVRPIGALPARWRSRYTVAQQRAAELILSPVRCTSRVRLIRISWEFAPGGPLRWLADAYPAFSTYATRLHAAIRAVTAIRLRIAALRGRSARHVRFGNEPATATIWAAGTPQSRLGTMRLARGGVTTLAVLLTGLARPILETEGLDAHMLAADYLDPDQADPVSLLARWGRGTFRWWMRR